MGLWIPFIHWVQSSYNALCTTYIVHCTSYICSMYYTMYLVVVFIVVFESSLIQQKYIYTKQLLELVSINSLHISVSADDLTNTYTHALIFYSSGVQYTPLHMYRFTFDLYNQYSNTSDWLKKSSFFLEQYFLYNNFI